MTRTEYRPTFRGSVLFVGHEGMGLRLSRNRDNSCCHATTTSGVSEKGREPTLPASKRGDAMPAGPVDERRMRA